MARPVLPQQLRGGLAAWFDFADFSTMTVAGGLVTEARSKAGIPIVLAPWNGTIGLQRSGCGPLVPTNAGSLGVLQGVASGINSLTSPYTIAYRCYTASGSNGLLASLGANTGNQLSCFSIVAGGLKLERFGGTTPAPNPPVPVGTHTYALTSTGSVYSMRFDGVSSFSDQTLTTAAPPVAKIGICGLADYNVSLPTTRAGEFLIWNRVLAVAELVAVERYLSVKWPVI